MKKRFDPEVYSKYLYIKSIYPNWKELDNFSSYRIGAIYKSLLKREEQRVNKLKEEQAYHQLTLFELGMKDG